MDIERIPEITKPCIHDEAAPCAKACPFGMDVRSFMRKAAKGRMPSVYKEFRTAVMFPKIVAELCDRPCLAKCQRMRLGDEPLDLERLEKAALSLTPPSPPDVFQIPEKEQKIAVIGAGVTGLSLALNMAQKKYPVTVFEKDTEEGGSLHAHPDFPAFLEDIRFQMSQENVQFCFGKEIRSLEELKDYKAVYIATGKAGTDFGLLNSWDPELYTTAETLVFMAGEVCGQSLMEGIAAGRIVSKLMEGAMQTGRVVSDAAVKQCDQVDLVPKGAVKAAHVLPADDAAGYTKAEVKEEAARCFLCNCDKCMKGCEVLGKYGKPPIQMGNEVAADLGAHFLASRTMTRESYSCTQCGWCKENCPEDISMKELFHVSRTKRVENGIQPEALHDFWLRELDFVSNEAFYASVPKNGGSYEYVFFPGCQLGADLPEQTIAAGRWLMENYQAGIVLGCCGASAWWAGEQKRWEENCDLIKDAWNRTGRPVFVLACATCSDMFRRLMPEIPTVSFYELLARAGVKPEAVFEKAVIFDPCAAGKDDVLRRSVRELAAASGTELTEPEEKGRCCGWGGHMRTANPALYDTITANRTGMSDLPYLVYCANCREVFLEKGKPCRHILEGIFGTEDRHYYLHEKRENRLAVKRALMKLAENRTMEETVLEWQNVKISVPEDVRKDMEDQLITDDDIKECIWQAQKDGDTFEGENGLLLAMLEKKVMTYWVEYKTADNGYEIAGAYCHRMKIMGKA